MTKIVPVYFAPDLDNAWSIAPGALASINMYAPLQLGAYGSTGFANYFGSSTLTGSDIKSAYMFRKVDGTVRFLVGRAANIDEYDSAATRTNRGTGYSTTSSWRMAAQGNAIVAVSPDNATQVSTGAGFSALGGGSPKAAHIASNFGFIMVANTDTSADQVWWSALYNYASFTPAQGSEAGNVRLLEAPGPITGLVAYRDGFVAFKDNALFVAEYVGPNWIWRWRCLSHKIGTIAPDSVVELDGKLYFLHSSGFYSFDGQTIQNIGLPIFRKFLSDAAYQNSALVGFPSGQAMDALSTVDAAADDVEGVVAFKICGDTTGTIAPLHYIYYYNARANKWGRQMNSSIGSLGGNRSKFVRCSSVDAQTFKASTDAHLWIVLNSSAGTTAQVIKYPIATATPNGGEPASASTGVIGSVDGSSVALRAHWRTLQNSDLDNTMTIAVNGYTNENKNVTNGSGSGTVNTEFDHADVRIGSRFADIALTQTYGKKTILAGIGIDMQPTGRR